MNTSTIEQTHIIDLRVRNHPGVMSHITGLFARRAFNLEAILCVPVSGNDESRMLLLVNDTPKLEQIERQLAKLHDVLAVRQRTDLPSDYFERLGKSI
ncbi:acetolactate synthase-1/3 small subunit [Ereboglobus sp. PH5-5]|nr:acetolactate synthase small subunit [Ereboglobus sp. PH5-5]MDF9832506.1 acetolactate synthase-1/3 small subunit [Ereboglobus sp. PH5-5]